MIKERLYRSITENWPTDGLKWKTDCDIRSSGCKRNTSVQRVAWRSNVNNIKVSLKTTVDDKLTTDVVVETSKNRNKRPITAVGSRLKRVINDFTGLWSSDDGNSYTASTIWMTRKTKIRGNTSSLLECTRCMCSYTHYIHTRGGHGRILTHVRRVDCWTTLHRDEIKK